MNMKEKQCMIGTVKAYIDGDKVFDSRNLILDSGLVYLASLLGGLTGEGVDFGIESIAVGDNEPPEGPDATQTDLEGAELGEGETTASLPDDGIVRFVSNITNTSGSTETHHEAVLTNEYDVGIGNRTCLSRVLLGTGIEVLDGQTITYIWEITFGR